MNESQLPVRVVVYRDDGAWFARCLEFDVLGQGDNYLDALLSLRTSLVQRVKQTLNQAERENVFTPAAGKYFQMFAAARPIPAGTVLARIPPGAGFTIEKIVVRQYVDGDRSRG